MVNVEVEIPIARLGADPSRRGRLFFAGDDQGGQVAELASKILAGSGRFQSILSLTHCEKLIMSSLANVAIRTAGVAPSDGFTGPA